MHTHTRCCSARWLGAIRSDYMISLHILQSPLVFVVLATFRVFRNFFLLAKFILLHRYDDKFYALYSVVWCTIRSRALNSERGLVVMLHTTHSARLPQQCSQLWKGFIGWTRKKHSHSYDGREKETQTWENISIFLLANVFVNENAWNISLN